MIYLMSIELNFRRIILDYAITVKHDSVYW